MKITALVVEDDEGNVQLHVYPHGFHTTVGSLRYDSKLRGEIDDPEFRTFVSKLCDVRGPMQSGDF